MADATENSTPEERHQNKVFRYVNWTSAAIFVIVVAVFFVPIPQPNGKYVDIAIGILLGILSSNSGTITGNAPTSKKPDATAATNTGDINLTDTKTQ